jgi:hypothetical protein
LLASAKIKPAANQVRHGAHIGEREKKRARAWVGSSLETHRRFRIDPPASLRTRASSTTFGVPRGARHRFRGVLCLDVGFPLPPPQPRALPSLFVLFWLFFSLMRTTANSPITREPGGPVDKPVNEIARRLNATADQVLLAWVKAKGAVAVTYGTPFLIHAIGFPDVLFMLSFVLSVDLPGRAQSDLGWRATWQQLT